MKGSIGKVNGRSSTRALIVDDEDNFTNPLKHIIQQAGYVVDVSGNLSAAQAAVRAAPPDLLFLDLSLPDGNGIDLLKTLKRPQDTRVIVVTGRPSLSTAIESIKACADDYLLKPIKVRQVRDCLKRIRKEDFKSAGVDTLNGGDPWPSWAPPDPATDFCGMVGCSTAIRSVFESVKRVAASDATVLIVGETGTGKEKVARAIHAQSGREGDFVAVNCACFPEVEMVATLSGVGNAQRREFQGYFQQAGNGTLLLDDVTTMSHGQQTRLLDMLEQCGSNVRVIATCRCNPGQAVAAGTLKEELYYRLSVFPIEVPPLRGRPDDIERLSHHYLRIHNRAHRMTKFLTDSVVSMFKQYSWPGNVRELMHVIEAAYIRSDTILDIDSLWAGPSKPVKGRRNDTLSIPIGTTFEDAEKMLIVESLAHHRGDKRLSAERLGVSLKTLYNKLNHYGQTL